MGVDDDAMAGDGKGEGGEAEGFEHGEGLGPEEEAVVPAVDHDAGEGGKEEGGDLAEEVDEAEGAGVLGEAVDEPSGGHVGEPRADEADELSGEEEAVVSGMEGRGRGRKDRWVLLHRQERSGVIRPALAPADGDSIGGKRVEVMRELRDAGEFGIGE